VRQFQSQKKESLEQQSPYKVPEFESQCTMFNTTYQVIYSTWTKNKIEILLCAIILKGQNFSSLFKIQNYSH
jgi:hypothetical protein